MQVNSMHTQLIPTPTQSENYFGVLQDTMWNDDDDEETVIMSNLSKDNHDCNNTTSTQVMTDDEELVENEFATLKYADDTVYAIFDSGATAHFIVQGAPVVNIRKALIPLKIKLPDGSFIESTHTCNLDIPWLPAHMTEAHIVPGLNHSSLISTRKFCDAGCRVIFDVDECKVYYEQKLVLSGKRDPLTGLWKVPINPTYKTSPVLPHLDLAVSNRTNEKCITWQRMCTHYLLSNNNSNSCIKLFSIHRFTR